MLIESTLEHKEDVWQVPGNTRILHVHCKLDRHSAAEVLARCRELEVVIFDANAHTLIDEETKTYLSERVFLEIEGELREHKVSREEAHKIRELYMRGDHSIDELAREFELDRDMVWQIIKEKAHG
ncbi:MAG: hypothetical protein ABIG20_05105 [archaeon]